MTLLLILVQSFLINNSNNLEFFSSVVHSDFYIVYSIVNSLNYHKQLMVEFNIREFEIGHTCTCTRTCTKWRHTYTYREILVWKIVYDRILHVFLKLLIILSFHNIIKLSIDLLTFENDGDSIFKVNTIMLLRSKTEKVNFDEITNEFSKIHFQCYKKD